MSDDPHRFTAHAVTRMAQRGVGQQDVELMEWIGTEVEGGYLVREKDFQALDQALSRLRTQRSPVSAQAGRSGSALNPDGIAGQAH
jgi:hypothetical protein